MVSKINHIAKALPAVRSITKAEIAKKLADGLPIAGIKDGKMVVEQLVERQVPHFIEKAVPASPIPVTNVEHTGGARSGRFAAERKAHRKSATAA